MKPAIKYPCRTHGWLVTVPHDQNRALVQEMTHHTDLDGRQAAQNTRTPLRSCPQLGGSELGRKPVEVTYISVIDQHIKHGPARGWSDEARRRLARGNAISGNRRSCQYLSEPPLRRLHSCLEHHDEEGSKPRVTLSCITGRTSGYYMPLPLRMQCLLPIWDPKL